MRTGRHSGSEPPPQPQPGPWPGRPRRPWLWRWHRNPLRRTLDLVEAWVILIAWIVVAVGGVFSGVVTARATEDTLHQQRADRHAVTAQLTEDTRWGTATAGDVGDHVRAKVRWTGPDGATHTGITLVDAGHQAGYPVRIWTDQHGKLTHAPPGDAEMALQSVLLGGAAAVACGGLTYVTGRGVRLGIDHRRAAHWDKEWEAVEPWWAHRMR